jgi:hypothetical protein
VGSWWAALPRCGATTPRQRRIPPPLGVPGTFERVSQPHKAHHQPASNPNHSFFVPTSSSSPKTHAAAAEKSPSSSMAASLLLRAARRREVATPLGSVSHLPRFLSLRDSIFVYMFGLGSNVSCLGISSALMLIREECVLDYCRIYSLVCQFGARVAWIL